MVRTINVEISGQFVRKDNKNAGVMGEGNVTTMSITFDETWRGFGKRIVWRDANGENPVSVVLFNADGAPDDPLAYETLIPAEPLAVHGKCSFTIEGYQDIGSVHAVSLSVIDYLFVAASGGDYSSPADPTPGEAEQVLEALGATEERVKEAATEARSWAIGGTGTRSGEDTDNAKYYAEQAGASKTAAGVSAAAATASAQNAAASETAAKNHSNTAAMWAIAAQTARNEANTARDQANLSASDAAASASAAKDSEENAGFKSSEAARYSAESKLWSEGSVEGFIYPACFLEPGETKKTDNPQFLKDVFYEVSGTRQFNGYPTVALGPLQCQFSGTMTYEDVVLKNDPDGGIVYENTSESLKYSISIRRLFVRPDFMSAKDWAERCNNSADSAAELVKRYPYIDPTKKTWVVWDSAAGTFVDTGILAEGQSGIEADGLWGTHIDEAGNLIVTYTGDNPPPLRINENGELVYSLADGHEVNLGKVTGSGGGGSNEYNIGTGLTLEEATNTLSVDTAKAVEAGSDKPITSAAVFEAVGNVEVLLKTI